MLRYLELLGLQHCNEKQEWDAIVRLEDATFWFINAHQVAVRIRTGPHALGEGPDWIVAAGIREGGGMISPSGEFTVVRRHSVYWILIILRRCSNMRKIYLQALLKAAHTGLSTAPPSIANSRSRALMAGSETSRSLISSNWA